MSTAPRENLSRRWFQIQGTLFPHMAEQADRPLTKHHEQLISVLEFVRIEDLLRNHYGCVGRPEEDRRAIFSAFVAKSVFNLATTVLLREYLLNDPTTRRICGFLSRREVPSESTFSRAYHDFAEKGLPDRVHEIIIKQYQSNRLVGHISRDATAVEAREKVDPVRKAEIAKVRDQKSAQKLKRGRPKKGETRPPIPLKRLERQQIMSLSEMLEDLPSVCDIGTKRNSKGHTMSWKGYKLHLDTADGGIPISAILTSASVHDSQVALPLATMTKGKVTNLYDIMDAAYDSQIIRDHSKSLGHVPLIDFNKRGPNDTRAFDPHEAQRYKKRSVAERMNARLKDEFGGRMIYVRGALKIKAHLMFGIIALTVDQLIRLIQ